MLNACHKGDVLINLLVDLALVSCASIIFCIVWKLYYEHAGKCSKLHRLS